MTIYNSINPALQLDKFLFENKNEYSRFLELQTCYHVKPSVASIQILQGNPFFRDSLLTSFFSIKLALDSS